MVNVSKLPDSSVCHPLSRPHDKNISTILITILNICMYFNYIPNDTTLDLGKLFKQYHTTKSTI